MILSKREDYLRIKLNKAKNDGRKIKTKDKVCQLLQLNNQIYLILITEFYVCSSTHILLERT